MMGDTSIDCTLRWCFLIDGVGRNFLLPQSLGGGVRMIMLMHQSRFGVFQSHSVCTLGSNLISFRFASFEPWKPDQSFPVIGRFLFGTLERFGLVFAIGRYIG
jgi:hypothetical protein